MAQTTILEPVPVSFLAHAPVDSAPLPLSRDRKGSIMSIRSRSSTLTTPPKSQEYMDSLKPPTPDGYERIASVQREKEEEKKRRLRELKRQHLRAQRERDSTSGENLTEMTDAARKIQKTFRGYRARREMEGYSLDPSTRWVTAIREAQFREATRPRAKSRPDSASVTTVGTTDPGPTSNARSNWKKASLVARRAGHDDLLSEDSDSSLSLSPNEDASPEEKAAARAKQERENSVRKSSARMMGLQYFLEMVDVKHRYGSNLRMYHEEWKKSKTDENFFYWLDYGEGMNIELDTCPRDRLEREQVRYLSREERQHYLVEVDTEGRLCWAKNGQRIDTTEKFKDSIHGIVPSDDSTPAFNPMVEPDDTLHSVNSNSSDSSLESKREADRAAKYATPGFDESANVKKVTHISASTVFNKLLRKSVKKNTWIFVADTSFRLYVGIKNSGAFQHSSFLQGSRISAAGLIKVRNGRLSSLSPLSGHYRPPAANFRAFVKSLKETHVDMSRVSISKSYAVLVGLEVYIKTRRKGKDLAGMLAQGKDKIIAPEEARQREEEARDKSKSAAREREVMEREREEGGMRGRVMQKMGIVPVREPRGQKGDGQDAA